ncbi:TetR family transcriptional regulator [Sneathiella chungangensis]|uniref:TetR family transcriptional regulator n=1 Tax=Sneathiella chungangensis TaxID=1418234 RepID=A0A845MHF5_9PROT|nr:TetR family transcriptional regulator [Sneathiella chungangensis]
MKPARKRRSWEQRARENRESLINAAAKTVGEKGYEGATIAEVTSRAGLSLGLFYQYFESRGDLFNQLLPAVGSRLIATLGQESSSVKDAVEGEKRAIRAYFDYLDSDKSIMRVFKEAEVYAPDAYNEYLANILRRYSKVLRRQKEQGEFQKFSEKELEVVATMLTMARVEFYERFAESDESSEWICDIFVKIVEALAKAK